MISWKDFERVELRVGTIISVEDFPEARKPAYKVRADFGAEIGVKQSSARITDLYSKESLLGCQIIGVVNFPSKQIGPFLSEFLVHRLLYRRKLGSSGGSRENGSERSKVGVKRPWFRIK